MAVQKRAFIRIFPRAGLRCILDKQAGFHGAKYVKNSELSQI